MEHVECTHLKLPIGADLGADVGQSLLRRFTDEDGKLYWFSKLCPDKGVLTGTTGKLFRQRHIYTAKDRGGTKNVRLEEYYAELEGDANPIIEKIVTSARCGKKPHLTLQEKEVWDTFFYNQWQRVPDFQQKVFETRGSSLSSSGRSQPLKAFYGHYGR